MVNKAFLDRLSELIAANGTSRYRLSKDAGLGDATVQSWYTSPNVIRPTPESIILVARVLRTDADELKRLAGFPEAQPSETRTDPILLRLLVDRLRELDKVDPDYSVFIEEMALYMLEVHRRANRHLNDEADIEAQDDDPEAVLRTTAEPTTVNGDDAAGDDRQPHRRYATPGAEAAAATRAAARMAVRARLLERL